MLLRQENKSADTFGSLESSEFKIAANGKAFRIIIDRLYSDKIMAPVRELSTNAFDSHCVAGIEDKPFTIHAPTVFEPEFSVRDYGVSMTHEVIMTVFNTAFESTKDTSNQEVGMYGLGSKSPWAYTDVFTVECFLDGEQRLYSAYMNDKGIPTIDLMGRQSTDEPNGVRVSFPVDPSDIGHFRRALLTCLRGFDVRPEINDSEIYDEIDSLETIVEGEGWKVQKTAYGTDTCSFVRQGCVLYPLYGSILSVTPEARELLSLNLMVDMPIGTVDITPSRESLSYDDTTKANLEARLNEIAREIVQSVETRLASCETYAEAVKLRNDVAAGQGHGSYGYRMFQNLKWRGRKVRSDVGSSLYPYRTSFYLGPHMMGISDYEMRNGRGYRQNKWNGRWDGGPTSVDPAHVVYYVEFVGDYAGERGYTEKMTHAGIRVREHYLENSDADSKASAVWLKVNSKGRLARLMAYFGRPSADQIVIVNDLPKPDKSLLAQRTSARTPVMCKVLNETGSARFYDETITSDDEDIVYISTRRGDFDDGPTLHDSVVKEWTTVLRTCGYIRPAQRVVQIPASKKSLLKANAEIWDNFFDLVAKCVEEKWSPAAYAYREQVKALVPDRYENQSRAAWQFTQSCLEHGVWPRAHNPLRTAMSQIRLLRRLIERHSAAELNVIHDMRRSIQKNAEEEIQKEIEDFAVVIDPEDAKALYLEIHEKYPLVAHVASPYSTIGEEETKHLLSYIDAMDAVA